MPWEVEYTDQFEQWWIGLSQRQQDSVENVVRLLMIYGPTLEYPYTSAVRASRYGHMRELRVQSAGRPIRILYAMDPRRVSILLIGDDKTGDERFYQRYVPMADVLYDEHLDELRKEELIE